jgi:Antibiotic biosynthesis monooxygenase
MYAAIRRYEGVDPGSVDELTRRSKESVMPMLSRMPGFAAHYFVDAGDGVVASISLFEDRAAAEESTRRILGLIKQEFGALLPNPPQITTGEVVAHKTREIGATS